MEIVENIKNIIQEMIIPELGSLKQEIHEVRISLDLTNKRLDDVNLHIVDQSRRIDEINKRIDSVRDELVEMISNINTRLDRLYESMVWKEEHEDVKDRLTRLEDEVRDIKERLAA